MRTKKSRLIAVDGPAASGKGTLARRIADHYDFAYLDTGLLYRAIGYTVIKGHGDINNPTHALKAAAELDPTELNNPELRSETVGEAASIIATSSEVREALLKFQKSFAYNPPNGKMGSVLDGRDIGTVVCSDADRKIFVQADISIRAIRRYKELRSRGLNAIHARVLQELKDRDARDVSRETSPLIPAKDAFILDTTFLDPERVFTAALKYVLF
ncbi:MAG: (d)CMP kinase [Rhodospirillaceae bacterium]